MEHRRDRRPGRGGHLARGADAPDHGAAHAAEPRPGVGHGRRERAPGGHPAARLLAGAARDTGAVESLRRRRTRRARGVASRRARRRRRPDFRAHRHTARHARGGGRRLEPAVPSSAAGAAAQPVRDVGGRGVAARPVARRAGKHSQRAAARAHRRGFPAHRVFHPAVVARLRRAGARDRTPAVPDGPLRRGGHRSRGRRRRGVRRGIAGAGVRQAVPVGVLRAAGHQNAGEDRLRIAGAVQRARLCVDAPVRPRGDRARLLPGRDGERGVPPARPRCAGGGDPGRHRMARLRREPVRQRRGRRRGSRGRPYRRGGGRVGRRAARSDYLWDSVPRRYHRPAPPRRSSPVDVPGLIARQLKALPDNPGVYLWKNAAGEILYVGKAKSLRARVPSYFGPEGDSTPERAALVRQIAELETIITPNEAQALLLENNLIKEHKPRFNIRLTDDKSYPRVAVTVTEPFPRVLLVPRENIPGARYFGPYTDVATLRQTLKIIRRIFTVRSCHWDLPRDAPNRPCLDYHIDRCRAPCVGYQSKADYRRMIDDVLLFLEGKTVDVRTRLRERMQGASQRLDFERAAQLRDALKWLDQLEQPQAVELVGGGDADAIGLARDGDDACGVVLRVRDGRLIARDHRFLENVEHEAEGAVLAAFLVRCYLPLEARARHALLPCAPDDLDALQQVAPDNDWHVPQRGTFAKLAQLADQNARHLLDSLKIESFDIDERSADPVFALGRDLGLPAVPRAFVCIDISTNQGRDTVGSLVWFEAGRPKKAEYRRFRIRGAPQDDFAAVHEVVTRYLGRRISEAKALPDLMVIDGSKGQLGAAADAARALGQEKLPIVSLAKQEEEVFLPGRPDPLRLSRRSPSLKLLQRARDEAHRFAVSYSRKRRAQRPITSDLLAIPGVGPNRRRVLLERFGSLAGVKTATPAEIAALPGFSTTLAERILERLQPRP